MDSLEFELSQWETIESLENTFDLTEFESYTTNNESGRISVFNSPSIDLRTRMSFPAFKQPPNHPSTYRGDAISSTSRLKLDWGRWGFTSTFDKDAYESRWDDLSRFSLSYRHENFQVVAGDLNLRFAHGLTFWNQSVYGSTIRFANSNFASDFKLTPATNTSVNSALRGGAVLWRSGMWQLITIASKTSYDAIRDADGNVLRFSDGGYHRSNSEGLKRGTLSEILGGIGGIFTHKFGEFDVRTGLLYWRANLSPELTQTSSTTDEFPLQGNKTSAIGLFSRVDWDGLTVSAEAAQDQHETGALSFSGSYDIEATKTRCKMTFANIPLDFNNPHASDIAGRTPKGLSIAGLTVDQKLPQKDFQRLIISFAQLDNKRISVGDDFPIKRNEISVEGEGSRSEFTWRSRLFYRTVSPSDESFASDNLVRFRFNIFREMTHLGRFGLWAESAKNISGENFRTTGHALGLTARTFPFNLSYNHERDGNNLKSLEVKVGTHYFNTAGLPIYEGEISYPDRPSIVRLDGNGVRLTTEFILSGLRFCKLSVRGARTWPIKSGTKGYGELYLSFTLKT